VSGEQSVNTINNKQKLPELYSVTYQRLVVVDLCNEVGEHSFRSRSLLRRRLGDARRQNLLRCVRGCVNTVSGASYETQKKTNNKNNNKNNTKWFHVAHLPATFPATLTRSCAPSGETPTPHASSPTFDSSLGPARSPFAARAVV
jgi:hypothetical protein